MLLVIDFATDLHNFIQYQSINPFIKIAADNAGKLQSINREK